MTAEAPMHVQLEAAVAIVEDSRETHVEWAALRQSGDRRGRVAGDLAFHLECIAEYDHVLEMLRSHPAFEWPAGAATVTEGSEA